MEAFREMIRGRLGKALLALLLLPFALVGIESYFVGGKAAPAATVNDEFITGRGVHDATAGFHRFSDFPRIDAVGALEGHVLEEVGQAVARV